LTDIPADTQECGSPLVCVTAPTVAPTITRVEAGHERATVYFSGADALAADMSGGSGSTAATVEFVVNALPVLEDQPTDGGAGGSTPVQSSFEVGTPTSDPNAPSTGAMEVDENGNPVAPDPDAPGPGALPALGALTSWSRYSPIVVLGLLDGVRYRFTIVAVNAAGSGPISAPSEPPIRPYPPPSAPPRFLRVSLPPEDDPERVGDLMVYFEPMQTPTDPLTSDVTEIYFIATAEPQVAGQVTPLSRPTTTDDASTATTATESDPSATGSTTSTTFVVSPSANGTTSPLRLSGLDPSLEYRLTLAAANGAGSSERSTSLGVYRADPTAPEWLQEGFGNEAALGGIVGSSSSEASVWGSEGSGIGPGGIAAAVLVPILVAAALGGGLFWRWQRAKERRTDGGGEGTSSTAVSRDASREPSRSKGPYQSPPLQVHAEAAGDLEADQLPTSPLNKTKFSDVHLGGHVRRRSSQVQVDIRDINAAIAQQEHEASKGAAASRASVSRQSRASHTSKQPQFHDREYVNPLSPAGAAAAFGIAKSIGGANDTAQGSPLASPSIDPQDGPTHEFASYPASSSLYSPQRQAISGGGAHQQPLPYSLRSLSQPAAVAAAAQASPSPSPSPTSPPPRMSPPPVAVSAAGNTPLEANMSPSPSPSPSPDPQAPFLRRPMQ
jgi:hypothetical protein